MGEQLEGLNTPLLTIISVEFNHGYRTNFRDHVFQLLVVP